MKRVCSICARGGSKGVAGKNVKELAGKPLIAYTIIQARQTKLFDYIVVSSDSDEILKIAEKYGVDYCIKRPDVLATDTAAKIPVIRHCVEETEKYFNTSFDICVDLDCTSPLRDVQDIINSVMLLEESNCENVVTGMPSRRSPYFNLVEQDEDGKINVSKQLPSQVVRRQDAPKTYDLNASIYVWKRDVLANNNKLFLDTTKLYEMPESRSIDIDTEDDYDYVSFLMRKKMSLKNKVVVVTGGAGLLGKVFCEKISQEGGIAVIADINLELATITSSEIKNSYPMSIDITSKESILKLIDDVDKKFGKIDAVVNNAYPRNKNYGRNFFDVEYNDFCENLGVNIGGYFLVSQCFAEYFQKMGCGNIVNISSIYGVVAPKFEIYEDTSMTMPVEYAAIKSGLIHLTRYMAKFLKGKSIRVNALSPGGILDSQPEKFLKKYNDYCLNKGMLEKQDMVGALAFLLSDESRYINGQNIVVDDGFSL